MRQRGDAALLEYTEKFDGVKLTALEIDKERIERAYREVDREPAWRPWSWPPGASAISTSGRRRSCCMRRPGRPRLADAAAAERRGTRARFHGAAAFFAS